MAYISQDTKKILAPAIKAVLAKYGMKGTIAIKHHSTLVVNIKSGKMDLVGEFHKYLYHANERCNRPDNTRNYPAYFQLNQYYPKNHAISEKVTEFYVELFAAMKGDLWYDKSDIMTDYFNTAYYLDVNVGNYKKPYMHFSC